MKTTYFFLYKLFSHSEVFFKFSLSMTCLNSAVILKSFLSYDFLLIYLFHPYLILWFITLDEVSLDNSALIKDHLSLLKQYYNSTIESFHLSSPCASLDKTASSRAKSCLVSFFVVVVVYFGKLFLIL